MLLDRLGRELDLSDLEELALESERFTIQQPANDLKRLIGAAASLTEWNVEAFEFLDRVTDADTQFETSARNRVDHRFLVGRQTSAAYQGVNVELEYPRGIEAENLRAAFLFQFTHLTFDRLRRMRP